MNKRDEEEEDEDEYSGFHTRGTDIDEAYSDTFQNDDDGDDVTFDKYNATYEE